MRTRRRLTTVGLIVALVSTLVVGPAAADTYDGTTHQGPVRPGDSLVFNLTMDHFEILVDERGKCPELQPGAPIVYVFDAHWLPSSISPPGTLREVVPGSPEGPERGFDFVVNIDPNIEPGGNILVGATVIVECGALAPFSANVGFGPFPLIGPPDPPPPPTCDDVVRGSFLDVDPASAHGPAVGCAAGQNVVTGFPDGTFRPARVLTRDQMASILERALRASGIHLPPGPSAFRDVTGTHADAINRLAAAGIVSGRTATEFGPKEPVTRGQFMTMLDNASRIHPPAFPEVTGEPFTDIATSVHRGAIARAHGVGIATGFPDGTFRPNATIRRDHAASFVTRWLDWRARQLTPAR